MKKIYALLLLTLALGAHAATVATSGLIPTNALPSSSLFPVSVPSNSPGLSPYVQRAVTLNTLLSGVPRMKYINFAGMTNQIPATNLVGQDGTAWRNWPYTNKSSVSNGAFSSMFHLFPSVGNHLRATNEDETSFMWMRLNYTNVNSGGSGYGGAYFLCSNDPFAEETGPGDYLNLLHISILNNSVQLDIWRDGGITNIGIFNFNPGWDVGGVSRLVGFYWGDNKITMFGDSIGFASFTNGYLNRLRPTNGRPSYVAFEQFYAPSNTNVIWEINFTELGFGNQAALNLKMPQFVQEMERSRLQRQITIAGYETQYGVYDALNLSNAPGSTASGNLLKAGTNNTDGMFWKNNHRFGIGTNTPDSKLHVQFQGSNGAFSLSGLTNVAPVNGTIVAAWMPVTVNGSNLFFPIYK